MQNKKFNRPKPVSNWLGALSDIHGGNVVMHHPVGESAKHNKQPVGMWWVIPLADETHKLLHSDHYEFELQEFGFSLVGRYDAEKLLYIAAVTLYEMTGNASPVPPLVHAAILDYHK